MATAQEKKEIAHEFRFFRVYKDGTVELLRPPTPTIPPFDDPTTGLRTKDAVISTNPPLSARLFLPKITAPSNNNKLPVLLFFHGGGFCYRSAFSADYHNHLAAIANEANVIAVSVEYGLFPARPLPACYEDAWSALQWIASHAGGNGPEQWLNNHGDLERVFVSGNSAGGNISHTVVSEVGKKGLLGAKIIGMILAHPYFGEDDRMWMYMCKDNRGPEDPRMKPAAEDLKRLGCERVVVFAAEKDELFGAGKKYVEELKKSGWVGSAELVVNLGMRHSQHVYQPDDEKAHAILKKIASFIHD
uniref:2-hydroxyisoflavanone dehydratase-4 n=1 Tax=Stylosanthes guianensis TaxID=62615 RepID=A0A6B9W2E8_9FABA|nr:2-hydroxyisoflavanone dehydratase-4 [Stylosanthes guianensis]